MARRVTDENNEIAINALIETAEEFVVEDPCGRPLMRAAEDLASMPTMGMNHAELLIDGEATFDSIMDGIDSAEKYILVQFYILKDDELGNRLKTHLIKKAELGVEIYLVYDEIGSNSLTKSYINECKDAGIKIRPFNTRKGFMNRFQLNFRNHRKIVVVDGLKTWIGGHNVGNEYLGKDQKVGNWRDTHTVIEGPAAISAQLAFAEDWYWAADEKLEHLNWKPTAAENGSNQDVLIIPSGPADELETASLMFLHAINHAQKRIWIASPYFVPDEAFVYALQLAGLRGVDVRILIPDKPDHYLVYLTAFSYIESTSLTGVKFYRYQAGFLHEKVVLVDDDVSVVGTANFDNRSFRLNFEVSACIIDKDYASQVEAMFEADFENSCIMEGDILSTKSWWFKLQVKLARLTSPVQ